MPNDRIVVEPDCLNQHEFGLTGNTRQFREPRGPDLLSRTEDFYRWQDARRQSGYWPYSRSLQGAPGVAARIRDDRGIEQAGVNFASQDYLSLATGPELAEAAIDAVRQYGVHSAGSAAVLGNTSASLALEAALAEFLDMPHVALYPTGWAAGYGVSRGLVGKNDYIVMDMLAHACLQEGALASTPKLSLYRHLDCEHAATILSRIRRQDRENGILVITEGLFSMDSDSPDIAHLQALCREHDATLVVDVAHDLGATWPGGAGQLGMQRMLGKVDLVMGSFSKTFGSNGGFVAAKSPAVKQFLKAFSPSQTFSNALSPAQAATVKRAVEIVRSSAGDELRSRLMSNIIALREALERYGLTVMGTPSPIVPVLIGREDQARIAASILPSEGVLANLVEFPAVPPGTARFRLQVMAQHRPDDTALAARGVATAIARSRDQRP